MRYECSEIQSKDCGYVMSVSKHSSEMFTDIQIDVGKAHFASSDSRCHVPLHQ